MGLLKVTGTIDVNQFWPHGLSDADTTKVHVQTGPQAFQFQSHPGAEFKTTKVFENSVVRGSGTKPPIKNGVITVRLQGIDAPELHYRPTPLGKTAGVTPTQRTEFKKYNKEYRQHFGESATVALGGFLAGFGQGSVPCTVTTYVNEPNDVFDTYGRFIGDIAVEGGGQATNVNLWLAREGWVFPTFYTSMTTEEINAYIAAAKTGKTKGRIWKKLQHTVGVFDPTLVFRKGGPPNSTVDVGPLLIPKLFRRQTSWWAYKQAGIVSGNFRKYLINKNDRLILTTDFLSQGVHAATERQLGDFLDSTGKFSLGPQDMAFKEKPSTLLDANGKKVTSWT